MTYGELYFIFGAIMLIAALVLFMSCLILDDAARQQKVENDELRYALEERKAIQEIDGDDRLP